MTRHQSVAALGDQLRARQWHISVAESCTGGGIASSLTEVSGSSDWFGYGFVTYSNDAKQSLLGVKSETLEMHGAVSEAVVREMAAGALAVSGAGLALSVSGVAGPGGGSKKKPVGTVWFGAALLLGAQVETFAETRRFDGDRAQVRSAAVRYAIDMALTLLDKHPV